MMPPYEPFWAFDIGLQVVVAIVFWVPVYIIYRISAWHTSRGWRERYEQEYQEWYAQHLDSPRRNAEARLEAMKLAFREQQAGEEWLRKYGEEP